MSICRHCISLAAGGNYSDGIFEGRCSSNRAISKYQRTGELSTEVFKDVRAAQASREARAAVERLLEEVCQKCYKRGEKKEIAKMHPWPAARTPLARPSPSIATGPSTDLFFPGMFLTREMSRQDLCCNLPPALAVAMQPDGERRKAAPWCKSGEASNK